MYGVIVGFSLGLTGGGGSIFAVPLLVYGLGVPARDAVTISLAAVGLTALFGAVQRWRAGQVEVRTGLMFAVAGMFGAPIGAWLSGLLSDVILLTLFAVLMLFVAVRMWRKAGEPPRAALVDP
ncbi:MAG: sulfite exporter TauE/SafE family protein, partial [Planctomycetaceae bacterium]|nr:sulfite exporter TauE/SafE family protein [Planctomycetaceae bacterium]